MAHVAACLIVRDGAATIERTLRMARPFVDEVCVLDTGSTDGTLGILEQLADEPGAPLRVERAEWRADYAWARERSFGLASPEVEWLLWLDDDDLLHGGGYLRRVLDEIDDATLHLYVRRVEHDDLNGGRDKLDWRIRLVRRDAGRWEGRIHEVIEPVEPLAFAAVNPRLVYLDHQRARVAGRHDHAAATFAEVDRSDAPARLLTAAGQELINAGQLPDAIRAYNRYLTATQGQFSELRLNAWERAATCYAALGDERMADLLTGQLMGERAAWARAAASGELEGVEALGPGWFDALRFESSGARNAPCPCGSGLKSKRCCGERLYVRPTPHAKGA